MQVKITLIYNMEEELKAWQLEHCLMIPSDLHVSYYALKQQVKIYPKNCQKIRHFHFYNSKLG